jgi:hypothetical protein
MHSYFFLPAAIILILGPHLCAQEQTIESLPALTVQTTADPSADEHVYWANHVMGLELDVFRLRLVPANHQAAGTTDFHWNAGIGLELGRIRSEGWSPFFRYSAFQDELRSNFMQTGLDNIAGRQRDIDFELYELGVQTPGFGSPAAHLYGDLAVGIPVLHLDRLQSQDDFLRRPLLTNDHQHFVGAGPHAGLNWEIPTVDHFFIDGRLEAGVFWGGFQTHEEVTRLDSPINLSLETYRQNKGGVLGQLGGELGLTYLYQADSYRLFFSVGYRYSNWFSNDLWSLESINTRRSRIEEAGPYFRFVFQY